MEQDSQARFSPTQWTLVEALKATDPEARGQAMEALAAQYWPPIYAHLRRISKSRDEAAELTQGFFADVVLTRRLFERADPNSFRLRTFLLHALQKYLIDEHRRQSSRKANFALSLEQIEAEEAMQSQWQGQSTQTSNADPANDYHRRWALVVLQEALARCEKHLKSTGRALHWELFEARFIRPLMSGSKQETIRALAAELGFASYTDAIVALRATRKKLTAVFLPQVLAETNSNADDRQSEYQVLLSLLP